MTGRIVTTQAVLEKERLRVRVELATEEGEHVEAELPQREVAALLPRARLIGTATRAPRRALETVQRLLAEATRGRDVRYWHYKERTYCSFISWRNIRFVDPGNVNATSPSVEGDSHSD